MPAWELVAMMAGLMSLNALAIDIMLPALPLIGEDLGLSNPNHRQWVVIGFAMGMGFGQLLFGPLADRFGRKPVLLFSLVAYAVFGAACNAAVDFEQLVAFRAAQGVSSAGARVVAVAVIRDLFRGAQMAETMSLVMMTFMAVPILAPAVGQGVLMFGSWKAIFWFLVLFAAAMGAWATMRLMETLPLSRRRPIDPHSLRSAYWEVLTNRTCRGYMLALGLMFGSLMAFLGASEQLFATYGKADSFALYFAGIAGGMAAANFFNSRLVRRFGPRRVGHTALVAFIATQLVHMVGLQVGIADFTFVYLALAVSFACLSLIGANFNAIALEPMGHLAGTASAGLGFCSTTLAAWFGGLVGQRFDGTSWPFAVSYLVLGTAALGLLFYTERGHLFGDSTR